MCSTVFIAINAVVYTYRYKRVDLILCAFTKIKKNEFKTVILKWYLPQPIALTFQRTKLEITKFLGF